MPMIEKVLLAAHDHFAGAQDGALALGDVAHQLHGGAEALLDVILDFFVGGLGDQHAAIALAEAQAGHVLFVHGHDPLTAALDEDHVGLDEAGLLAVVVAAGARIEGADELDGGMRLGGSDLRRAGKIFHIALLQQIQVAIDDERRHFHAAAALFDFRLGLRLEAAMRIVLVQIRLAFGVKMAEFLLLRGDLDQQALAQVARPDAGGIKMLHQVNGSAHQLERLVRRVLCTPVPVPVAISIRNGGGVTQRHGQLIFAGSKISVFVQIADHELDGHCNSSRASEPPAATPGDRTSVVG